MTDTPRSHGMNGNPYDALFWRPLRELMGLDQERWDNLTNLVSLHMVLDRLLSLRIFAALFSQSKVSPDGIDKLFSSVASISFERRLEIGTLCGCIHPDIATHLREVNRVRNATLHFNIAKDFGEITEITSAVAFDRLVKRGLTAFTALGVDARGPSEVTPFLADGGGAEEGGGVRTGSGFW
jgi:hypothetical protein